MVAMWTEYDLSETTPPPSSTGAATWPAINQVWNSASCPDNTCTQGDLWEVNHKTWDNIISPFGIQQVLLNLEEKRQ